MLRIVSNILLVGGVCWILGQMIRAKVTPRPGHTANRLIELGALFGLFGSAYPQYDAIQHLHGGPPAGHDRGRRHPVGSAAPSAIESGNLPVVPRGREPTRNCLPALPKRDAADHRRGPAVRSIARQACERPQYRAGHAAHTAGKEMSERRGKA